MSVAEHGNEDDENSDKIPARDHLRDGNGQIYTAARAAWLAGPCTAAIQGSHRQDVPKDLQGQSYSRGRVRCGMMPDEVSLTVQSIIRAGYSFVDGAVYVSC